MNLLSKQLRTLGDVRHKIQNSKHPISFWKYLIDAVVSRFFYFLSLFYRSKLDKAYFEAIHGSEIIQDYESKQKIGLFWRRIAHYQWNHCNASSFKNFKRTVNRRFFWVPCNDDHRYLDYYYEKVKKKDTLDLLTKIQEPSIGNPKYFSKGNNNKLTQDLIRSIDEFYSIYAFMQTKQHWHIAEIGAGYGRLAFIFLAAFPYLNIETLKYAIIDIPPALLLSSQYYAQIQSSLQNCRAHFYSRSNPFKSWDKKHEKSSEIYFCLPDQFSLLEDTSLDCVINISSFEEMEQETVNTYFDLIDQKLKTGGRLYTKQWGKSSEDTSKYTPENLKKYPYKNHWKKELDQTTEPPFYFEAIYQKGEST